MKEYIKPQMAVIQCECNTILAASNLKYNDEEADKNIEVLSEERRGSWGDLWN